MHQAYFDRCQVDTPLDLVKLVWDIVAIHRRSIGVVFDPGAGDGRFSLGGVYKKYIGYELDIDRISSLVGLPENAKIFNEDAFKAQGLGSFDLVIGNPPYVRHHDLDDLWRKKVSDWIYLKSGVKPSGLSNAYLYFLWLSVLAANESGLIAQLVPFDWVSRPAAKSFRAYIEDKGWGTFVYRLNIDPFPGVLTTACVVIIDKSSSGKGVSYYRVSREGVIESVDSPTLSVSQPIGYTKREGVLYANRGLSPGDQKVFLLNEQQRQYHGLAPYHDVVPAISSMRHCVDGVTILDDDYFIKNFIDMNHSCWLINTGVQPSESLQKYLDSVEEKCVNNATCKNREIWWKYKVPKIPEILYSSGFRGKRPKMFVNQVRAVHVGAVCAVYCEKNDARSVIDFLSSMDIGARVVALSKGFKKIEINQMNSLLKEFLKNNGGVYAPD